MNIWDVVIILLIVAVIIISAVRLRKRGGTCDGNCSGCSGCLSKTQDAGNESKNKSKQ